MTKANFLVMAGLTTLVGLPVLAPLSAAADDSDLRAVNNRLDRLERSVNDMQGGGYSGESESGGAGGGGAPSADVSVRLNDIEDQIRTLTGRVEELSHRIDQTSQDLQTFKADVDLRFQDLRQGGGAAAPAAGQGAAAAPATGPIMNDDTAPAGASAPRQLTPPGAAAPATQAAAAPTAVLPNGTPQVQYDFAIDLLKRGQFPQARDTLKQFLDEHPKDSLAGNAQYWLGETYYVQGQYKDAADSFLKGYTTYSKSPKAPDSLLKLGMTLNQLGQKDAACATFGQLKEQFPQAAPAIVARAKQERQKAGC
ncbi:tol-pal system protein YbgF [Parvibaculum sp.]|uniref:tol-pal system protein YbgF n=1 Tax=Parvibaculum sp. TaxID=2024848 RepID=UPI00320E71F8